MICVYLVTVTTKKSVKLQRCHLDFAAAEKCYDELALAHGDPNVCLVATPVELGSLRALLSELWYQGNRWVRGLPASTLLRGIADR